MLQILSVFRPDDLGSFIFGCIIVSAVWLASIIVLMFFMSASESGKRIDEIHRRACLGLRDEVESV